MCPLSEKCRLFCKGTWVKFMYLACATLVTASFIVECILVHLVVVPYLSESGFLPATCAYNRSLEIHSVRCENKCSKDRSLFPCLKITVTYVMKNVPQNLPTTELTNQRLRRQVDTLAYESPYSTNMDQQPIQRQKPIKTIKSAFLYDYYNTYARYRSFQCATSPCRKREDDNKDWVEEFKKSLHDARIFDCYVSSKNPDEVLLHKLHPHKVFMHSVLWPCLVFTICILFLILTYSIDRCSVWADDKTVIA